jgi:hypothetical protein
VEWILPGPLHFSIELSNIPASNGSQMALKWLSNGSQMALKWLSNRACIYNSSIIFFLLVVLF